MKHAKKSDIRHTEGKWYVMPYMEGSEEEEFFVRSDIGGDESVDIAVMINDEEPSSPRANANLIAAAPELLKLCKAVLKIAYDKDIRPILENSWFIEALKIIEKAEVGEVGLLSHDREKRCISWRKEGRRQR